ncbi:unnamed protein product [Soboliphyme baturini]|uniref:RNA_pol_L_2 domain-containing protein n=1 Tax=Soboliphyme baturini TaxID=241478 RepID=A0A183ICK2_9BILA|nr:unnamed protein product [Soboliphyme baturini]
MAEDVNSPTKKFEKIVSDKLHDHTVGSYIFHGEDHTLGNALKHMISHYPEVEFCGYNVPNPLEDQILFRIQTRGIPADVILRRGLNDLDRLFGSIEEKFKIGECALQLLDAHIKRDFKFYSFCGHITYSCLNFSQSVDLSFTT